MTRAMLTACILLFGHIGTAQERAPLRVTFNIPAQPVQDALNEFARQTGLQVMVVSDVARDVTAPAVEGELTAEVALTKLLANSTLRFEFVNPNAVAIRSVHDTASVGESSWQRLRLAQVETAEPGVPREAAESSANSAGNPQKQVGLEEIIVTATKRAENVREVPISIAVVTAEDIDRRGLVSAEDYLRGVPGVNQTSETFGQTVVIRGIETSAGYQNFFGAATVATYFGETPTTSSGGVANYTNVDVSLMDIERVEVLRGPQGTAFGSSSLGGVIRTIPVTPKLDRFEGKVSGGYSVTSGTGGNNSLIQGVFNFPLIVDKLAVRAVGYRVEDSGYYRNIAGSNPGANATFLSNLGLYGGQSFAVDKDELGSSLGTGGRIAALLQASDALRFTLSYMTQKLEIDGIGMSNASTNGGPYDEVIMAVAPGHVSDGRRHGFFDNNLDIANAMMEYDLSWGDLLATYSHIESETPSGYPLSVYAGNPWPVSSSALSDHRGNIAEVRLSTKLTGAWNFLGGLYSEDLDDEANFVNSAWYGNPEANLFPGYVGSSNRNYTRRDLKQKAVFAEASWKILPSLTLTGGARAYEYDRTEVTGNSGAFGNSGPTLLSSEASGTSYRGNLSYKPADNALLYASWSQGFRLGRAQPGLFPGTCDPNGDGVVDGTSITIESTRKVNSDSLDNYEIGGKFSLLDRRMTIAADVFRINWSEVPVLTLADTTNVGCYAAYTANLGTARSEGVELQANFYFTEGLRADVGGSWIDARLTKDVPAIQGAVKGNRLPASPSINANLGLQYEFKVGNYETSVRADSIYVGSFHGNLTESADTKAGGYVKVDFSARVSLKDLDVDLFIRNLTNADEYTSRSAGELLLFSGYRLRPRTVGVRMTYDF